MGRRSRALVVGLGSLLALLPGTRAVGSGPEAAPLAAPLGTGITYQGFLRQGGVPANGAFTIQFQLFDAATGGTPIGPTVSQSVAVTNGQFTVPLDFGAGAFNGEARWLAITVQGTPLNPRQEVRAAPYALALGGLRTEPNGTSPNVMGGFSGNSVTVGVVGATIGGGGLSANPNRVTDDYGTVGGGANNRAGDNAGTTSDRAFATVGGGQGNTASGAQATVGGGFSNTASGLNATVGGGQGNTASGAQATVGGGVVNTASGGDATVGGGSSNRAPGVSATVGGGSGNTASGTGAAVGGGSGNTASGTGAAVGGGNGNMASGSSATVGGGVINTASGTGATVGGGGDNTASGVLAMVPGGFDNKATGDFSFAAGRHAWAFGAGTFVWNDSNVSGAPFASNTNLGSGPGQFNVNFDNSFHVRATGGVRFVTSSSNDVGIYLAAGGNAWLTPSHSSLKTDFAAVDTRAVLEGLVGLPLTTWRLREGDPTVRHLGPMAEDFYAAFGLGHGEQAISTLDADGVAFAAIQGLYHLVQEQAAALAALQAEHAALAARLAAVEQAGAAGEAP